MNTVKHTCATTIAVLAITLGGASSAQTDVRDIEPMIAQRPEVIDINSTPILKWANGKGARREVAMEPLPGGAPGSFSWRVGIAFYIEDAPFSSFGGIDRWIALIKGSGIAMRSDDGKIDAKLDSPLQPYAFQGEAKIDSRSLGGTSELFNVLTTRDRFTATVTNFSSRTNVPSSRAVVMVYCVTSPQTIKVQGQPDVNLNPGQAALWRSGSPKLAIETEGSSPTGLLVRIDPV